MLSRLLTLGSIPLLLVATACTGQPPATQPDTRATPAGPDAPASQPADPLAPPTSGKGLKGITVNREAGYVDVDATVVLREGEWLELLACTPDSKEHESILTVAARPSHVHLALLMLGTEPGKPLTYEEQEDGYKIHPPRGPEVAVAVVEGEGDDAKVTPANQWVLDQETGKPMPDSMWLFTGSKVDEFEGEKIYVADVNGTAITLVSFGDDLLSRNTEVTDRSEGSNDAWKANTKLIPEVGTKVKLRLTPVKNEAEDQPQMNTDEEEPAPAPSPF